MLASAVLAAAGQYGDLSSPTMIETLAAAVVLAVAVRIRTSPAWPIALAVLGAPLLFTASVPGFALGASLRE